MISRYVSTALRRIPISRSKLVLAFSTAVRTFWMSLGSPFSILCRASIVSACKEETSRLVRLSVASKNKVVSFSILLAALPEYEGYVQSRVITLSDLCSQSIKATEVPTYFAAFGGIQSRLGLYNSSLVAIIAQVHGCVSSLSLHSAIAPTAATYVCCNSPDKSRERNSLPSDGRCKIPSAAISVHHL